MTKRSQESRAVVMEDLNALRAAHAARQSTRADATESPLPLRERDRVRGLAPAGAGDSGTRKHSPRWHATRHPRFADAPLRIESCRAAARDPSPCPSPSRGEGTLQGG